MSTDDLDLDALRRKANTDSHSVFPGMNQYARTVLTLLDRIERAEAKVARVSAWAHYSETGDDEFGRGYDAAILAVLTNLDGGQR